MTDAPSAPLLEKQKMLRGTIFERRGRRGRQALQVPVGSYIGLNALAPAQLLQCTV